MPPEAKPNVRRVGTLTLLDDLAKARWTARLSRFSNQRPDTLMQDRVTQIDEIFLHRTAGPYIWVIRVDSAVPGACPLYPR